MKIPIHRLLIVLVAGAGLLLVGRATAQTFTTLYNLGSFSYPWAGLIISGGSLYGTTENGGINGGGTVFSINTDGTAFTTLYSFKSAIYPSYANTGGSHPYASLISAGNTLFGTTFNGGSTGYGTVFGLKSDGTGFAELHVFAGGNGGSHPYAGLVLSGDTLYGTTFDGGASGNGTVFAIATNGLRFETLYSFTMTNAGGLNSDGSNPRAGLILSGNTLYGATVNGGTNGCGTVFRINTDGTGFANLNIFAGANSGSHPYADLILSGNTLYGTTSDGGASGYGTVFATDTNGVGFRTLHSFTAPDTTDANNDGANPRASLVLLGGTVYGTTLNGGAKGMGAIFEVNTDGTGFTSLYSFASTDGANPEARLLLWDNTLYGTTSSGGASGTGTVFALTLAASNPTSIPLNAALINGQLVLSWSDPTFALQSAGLLAESWSNVINATSPYTNSVSTHEGFFRLIQ